MISSDNSSLKSAKTDQNQESPWLKSLKKSLTNNAQLQFSKMVSIAYIYEGEANVDTFSFDTFEKNKSTSNDYSLLFSIDSRKKTFAEMKDNKKVEVAWYFPLTKEQYRIKCNFSYVTNSEIEEDSHSKQILLSAWDKINKEDRKQYHEPHPDTLKKRGQAESDLDRFNSLDKNNMSCNFAILLLTPIKMEITSFAMPQVVADGRKEFESLFKPYKKHRKCLIELEEDGKWIVKDVNP